MKLITFDRSKNVNYFGDCKLQFNGPEKCLNLKMLDKDSEDTITATFNRIFICKNNLLCSMNQNLKNAMILVFSTKEKCERIFNAIIKVKSRQSQTNEVVIDGDGTFKENFFLPLVKASESGIDGFQDLKTIIHNFVNSMETNEQNYYLNTLLQIPNLSEEKDKSDKQYMSLSSVLPPDSETSASVSNKESLKNSLKCKTRKRKNINESDKIPRKKPNVSIYNKPSNVFCLDVPTPQNSSNDVSFDIVEFLQNRILTNKLIVFTSKEKKQCYEFIFYRKKYCFRCIKCFAQKKYTEIKVTRNEDGSRSLDFNAMAHICEPLSYVTENYQSLIVHSPNFQLMKREEKRKMYAFMNIFNSEYKNMCHKFGFDSNHKYYFCYECKRQGRTITARFIQHDGKTAVELNSLQHICHLEKYIP